jgi:putative PIN family toxin of toxin-antitoxin system
MTAAGVAGSRPRAVIDTNVLLDFWVFDDRRSRALRAALDAGDLLALSSADCDAELHEVLSRPVFALSAHDRARIIERWESIATRVPEVARSPLACTDARDQKFLDLAEVGRANWLLTKDKALLRLARKAAARGLWIGPPESAALAGPQFGQEAQG